MAATFGLRIILRPISLKLCFRYGLKTILIIGTVLYSINYPLLGQIEGIDSWFFLFIFIFSLTDTFYWLPYHTIFAVLGDKEHRGKQTSIRDGIFKIAEFSAPLISGILVVTYGYWAAFLAAMVFMFIAAIPLIKVPKLDLTKFDKKIKHKKQIEKEGFWLYAGGGFFHNHSFIWTLVLFLIVLNPAYFGGLIGLAIIFQFLLNIFVGHLFDKGKGNQVSKIGTLLLSLAIVGRGLFVDTVPEVILFDIIFAIGYTLYMPIFNSTFYNLSKESKHPLWFQYYGEKGWDVGSVLATLMTAFIVYLNNDLRLAMILSLGGLLVANYILRKYFANFR
jgi:MFS family permease